MNLFDRFGEESMRMEVWAGPKRRFSEGLSVCVSGRADNLIRRGVRSPLWELVWREVWSSVYVRATRSTKEYIREFS